MLGKSKCCRSYHQLAHVVAHRSCTDPDELPSESVVDSDGVSSVVPFDEREVKRVLGPKCESSGIGELRVLYDEGRSRPLEVIER